MFMPPTPFLSGHLGAMPPSTYSHSCVRHLSPCNSPSGFWGQLSPTTQPKGGNVPRGTSPGIPHSPLRFPQILPIWVNSPFIKSCSNSPSWVWSLFPSKSKVIQSPAGLGSGHLPHLEGGLSPSMSTQKEQEPLPEGPFLPSLQCSL